ncbi:MAG: DUF3137 domain-containing protein [Hellea sp.]|nr:DUF3137 domain-containing protein [Hellea sp.]
MDKPVIAGNMLSFTKLRQHLYGEIGWTFKEPGRRPEILSNLEKWRMIKSYVGGYDFNGTLTGIGFDGQPFQIHDLSVPDIPGEIQSNSYFRGVIVSLRQANLFSGRTIIAEDKGVYNPTTVDLMQRIKFESDDFEHIFEVYSDCYDEASQVITSGMVKRLTNFSQLNYCRKVQCVLDGPDVHFILRLGNNFSFSQQLPSGNFDAAKKGVIAEAGNICILFEQLFRIQACIGQIDSSEASKSRLAFYKKCLVKMLDAAKNMESGTGRSATAPDDNNLSYSEHALSSPDDTVRRKAS